MLGACGSLVICGSACNPLIAIGVAAVGVGLLALIGTLSVTQYLKHSSTKNIEKLEKLDSNAEQLLATMTALATLLNGSYAEKEKIKDYTIQQLKDCLKNETQRKENRFICDNLMKKTKS